MSATASLPTEGVFETWMARLSHCRISRESTPAPILVIYRTLAGRVSRSWSSYLPVSFGLSVRVCRKERGRSAYVGALVGADNQRNAVKEAFSAAVHKIAAVTTLVDLQACQA